MIYYIASYPRSGNSWVISLLANNFFRLTTGIHARTPDNDGLARLAANVKKLYDLDISLPIGIPQKTKELGELAQKLFSYEIHRDNETVVHTGLIGGCQHLLTRDNRRKLAEAGEPFFLKTHLMPYDQYFSGEHVIQIIRNPGACLWSYHHFLKDIRNTSKSLTDIINGKVGFGCWSDYHEKWMRTGSELGSQYLCLKYEDLYGAELECCRQLSQFMKIPVQSGTIQPFDHYHEILPRLIRQGQAKSWEQYYSPSQLKLLWQKHGPMMTAFGYPEPDAPDGHPPGV